MKEISFAVSATDPWCPGCGHSGVTRSLQKSLSRKFLPLEVVIVSDIGCIGIADMLFTCHTVHGLHGRAPALAGGIALTSTGKVQKVVALMGDGGASIGLQHICECARKNFNIMLVVCNNQNYGMTGGQTSGFTLKGVRTSTEPEGVLHHPYDLLKIMESFDVPAARILATDPHLPDIFEKFLSHEGFSLIETIGYCPSYAGKYNPGILKPKEIKKFFEDQGFEFGLKEPSSKKETYYFNGVPEKVSLQDMEIKFQHNLKGEMQILLAGSAGEGVQLACELFSRAAVMSGLFVSFNGEYPVTVGKGFSCGEIYLSSEPDFATSGGRYDLILITSQDGLNFVNSRLQFSKMIVVDSSLVFDFDLEYEKADFRKKKNRVSSILALNWALERFNLFPKEALLESINKYASSKAREELLSVLTSRETDS